MVLFESSRCGEGSYVRLSSLTEPGNDRRVSLERLTYGGF